MASLFFLFPWALAAEGRVSYHFDTLEGRIAPETFRRYVRPSVREVVENYFALIQEIAPESAGIVRLRESLRDSAIHFPRGKDIPPSTQALWAHYGIDREISLILPTLIVPGRKRDIDEVMVFRNILSELHRENVAFIREMEEVLLTFETPYVGRGEGGGNLHGRRERIGLHFDQLIALLLPSSVSGDFKSLYLNFIRPLENRVFTGREDSYLMANLERLNNIWNAFHMRVTKSSIKMDKRAVDTAQLMHRRWNGILKILL